MPAPKKIFAFPQPVRSLFYHLATSSSSVSKTIPYTTQREAMRDRARLYQLRKLLAEAASEMGNETLAEKFYTIGIRYDASPENPTLTLFNHSVPFNSSLMQIAQEFVDTTTEPTLPPDVTQADIKALEQRLFDEESDKSGASAYVGNPYLSNKGDGE